MGRLTKQHMDVQIAHGIWNGVVVRHISEQTHEQTNQLTEGALRGTVTRHISEQTHEQTIIDRMAQWKGNGHLSHLRTNTRADKPVDRRRIEGNGHPSHLRTHTRADKIDRRRIEGNGHPSHLRTNTRADKIDRMAQWKGNGRLSHRRTNTRADKTIDRMAQWKGNGRLSHLRTNTRADKTIDRMAQWKGNGHQHWRWTCAPPLRKHSCLQTTTAHNSVSDPYFSGRDGTPQLVSRAAIMPCVLYKDWEHCFEIWGACQKTPSGCSVFDSASKCLSLNKKKKKN